MVGHRGSCNYARAVVKSCGLSQDMVFMLKTPYVFDVHVQDIFVALCAGGTLAIAPPGAQKDAGAICDVIEACSVNCLCFVPTLLVEFLNYISNDPSAVQRVGSVRRILTIGEALMSATCDKLFQRLPSLQIHNLYGPTEASVGVSHHMVTASTVDITEAVVPIGKPYDYVTFKVYDPAKYEHLQPGAPLTEDLLEETAPGETGELFIGGDCLAKGYVNNPEKTSAAFFSFPALCERPRCAASPFSLYKTGDLVKQRPDGVFDYLGRSDFQVKIGGVRVECEEVSAVLKEHPAVDDALVVAFDGPFGKALAAYVVLPTNASPETFAPPPAGPEDDAAAAEGGGAEGEDSSPIKGSSLDSVSKWGAVYDEMYLEQDNSISEQDPTLNWSGYIDTYTGVTHLEPVIKEWVEWCCEQVASHRDVFERNRADGRPSCVVELGCGNGMLLFRLAPVVGEASRGRYIGTDISATALAYVRQMRKRPEYASLGIELAQLAAHELDSVCGPEECDVVLCNGVTMYFPDVPYLVDCMKMGVAHARPGGHVIYGDVQSKRHHLALRAHVETFQRLGEPETTAASLLRAVHEMASHEELSYFDDSLFSRMDRVGGFGDRVARVELRLKRGWWQSEFNRFRYDVELVLKETDDQKRPAEPKLDRVTYAELCASLGISQAPDGSEALVDRRLVQRLPGWVSSHLTALGPDVEGVVVCLPNARTLQSARLLQWLEEASSEQKTLADLPRWLRPSAAELGDPDGSAWRGVEPEMLFAMELPEGWTKRVIWGEDAGMLRLVLLRTSAADRPWLGAACEAPLEPMPADLSAFKNRQGEYLEADSEPTRAWNQLLKDWTATSRLLPAMRPAVYVTLEGGFPKNAAGKVDRAKLPDASNVLEQITDAAELSYEPPETEDEKRMAAIWERVLQGRKIGANTPFTVYGGHSLAAVQLSSAVTVEFGVKPDLLFLTSAACTVRELTRRTRSSVGAGDAEGSCVVRLSRGGGDAGLPLLIFGSAGSGAASYQAVARHLDKQGRLDAHAVEYRGRGLRAEQAAAEDFGQLLEDALPAVTSWAKEKKRFAFWGDSLGSIVAYEVACRLQESTDTQLELLAVSGNPAPAEASKEVGVGGNFRRGAFASAADLSHDDWRDFLLSAGDTKDGELEQVLSDPQLSKALIGPLRADCLAYESYKGDGATSLAAPILTMAGERDGVCAPESVKTWAQVAGSGVEHVVLPRAGHRIAQECPQALASILGEHVAQPGERTIMGA